MSSSIVNDVPFGLVAGVNGISPKYADRLSDVPCETVRFAYQAYTCPDVWRAIPTARISAYCSGAEYLYTESLSAHGWELWTDRHTMPLSNQTYGASVYPMPTTPSAWLPAPIGYQGAVVEDDDARCRPSSSWDSELGMVQPIPPHARTHAAEMLRLNMQWFLSS